MPFVGTPGSSQLRFSYTAYHPQLWVLNADEEAGRYPPAKLTDSMFRSVSQNGWGVYAPSFFWQLAPPSYLQCDG